MPTSVENYVPYEPNAQGFTEALIDLKSSMGTSSVFKVTGYEAVAFENVVQGQALYSRASDGQVGLAIASDTLDKAIDGKPSLCWCDMWREWD